MVWIGRDLKDHLFPAPLVWFQPASCFRVLHCAALCRRWYTVSLTERVYQWWAGCNRLQKGTLKVCYVLYWEEKCLPSAFTSL